VVEPDLERAGPLTAVFAVVWLVACDRIEPASQQPLLRKGRYVETRACAGLGYRVGVDPAGGRVLASAPFLQTPSYSCPELERYNSRLYRLPGVVEVGAALPDDPDAEAFAAVSVGESLAGMALDHTADGVADVTVGERGKVLILDGARFPALLDDALDLGEAHAAPYGLTAGDLDRDGIADVVVESHGLDDGVYGYYWQRGPPVPAAGSWFEPSGTFPGVIGRFPELIDVDGDNALDLVVGDQGLADGEGGLVVVYDPVAGVDPSTKVELVGSTSGQHTTPGGDLDDDGRPDLGHGSQEHDGRRGRAWVVSGSAVASGLLDELAQWRFTGLEDGDFAGYSSAIADLNGDGAGDWAVAEPFDSYESVRKPGRVAVLFGPLADGDYTDAEADVILTTGVGWPDLFGYAMATGDLDGDAAMELVVGAPDDPDGADAAGSVNIFLGADW
jgi:hypothetical protein